MGNICYKTSKATTKPLLQSSDIKPNKINQIYPEIIISPTPSCTSPHNIITEDNSISDNFKRSLRTISKKSLLLQIQKTSSYDYNDDNIEINNNLINLSPKNFSKRINSTNNSPNKRTLSMKNQNSLFCPLCTVGFPDHFTFNQHLKVSLFLKFCI